jgi:hypothetical protein
VKRPVLSNAKRGPSLEMGGGTHAEWDESLSAGPDSL